jgi:protein-S-isoprenylcysteine O-methyltransferase Ste14
MVRHPLYLGNYLMWSGIVIFTCNIWFFLIMSLAYWLYYERIMFAEERFLERKYGEEYLNWSLTVPAFIPSLKNPTRSQVPFSFRSVLRREYSGILATVAGFAFIDQLRHFFILGVFDIWRISSWCLIVALVFALLFRTLKHHTKLLNESDRS